ncbi:hypothetical protein [Streptomyces sp. NPDC057426]|uniref:hypothetical protein n=1 Tax=Streptomyces sp. NPDC057426 TaxID=3346128 RepID=UPI0036AEB1BE
MNVDDVVATKVAAARARIERERRRRAALAAARNKGLAIRHAQKLRNLARRQADDTVIELTEEEIHRAAAAQLLGSQEKPTKES